MLYRQPHASLTKLDRSAALLIGTRDTAGALLLTITPAMSGLLSMDASMRSTHGNAYFIGFGRSV